MGEGFFSRFKECGRTAGMRRVVLAVGMLLFTLIMFACTRSHTRQFVIDEYASEVPLGDWSIASTGVHFYSLHGFGGNPDTLGPRVNMFSVGIEARAKRVNGMRPYFELDIDSMDVELVESGESVTFYFKQAYFLGWATSKEVIKSFQFVDVNGSERIYVPEGVDTLRVSFVAKLTDKSAQKNVVMKPVKLTMLRVESSTPAFKGYW